jgi:uncharacterized protein
MRSLLDVNVLIALLDSDHVAHATATQWFATYARQGWASSPITQNGCVRVMSGAAYPNAPPLQAVVARLAGAAGSRHHEFWPDDVSLLNEAEFDRTRMHGPRQITDCYLLALAVRHAGRLVTFDSSIPLEAVRGATARHRVVL